MSGRYGFRLESEGILICLLHEESLRLRANFRKEMKGAFSRGKRHALYALSQLLKQPETENWI